MRYGMFFCREDQMWHDGWSYGDWKQYICNRPGGQTQCARFSRFPIFGLMLGLSILLVVVVTVGSVDWDYLDWVNTAVLVLVSLALCAPFVSGWFFGVYLMVAVGPMNDGTRRVCPWDKSNTLSREGRKEGGSNAG